MKARGKVMVSFLVLVLLLLGMYFFSDWFSKTIGYATGEDEKIKLAQCLDGKGTILYISGVCPYCEQQIEVFGATAISYLNNIVDCDSGEFKSCNNLKGVPAWKIGGDFYYGVKDIEELGMISGCDEETEG